MSYIAGVGVTPFGKLPGRSTLDLMSEAASAALADAHLTRGDIDGLLCGYSTTFPHLMLSTVFAEHFGLNPAYASPLKLLDCCPVSDGGAAFVVSSAPTNAFRIRIVGTGQAHTHQHVSAAPSLTEFGARQAFDRARAEAGIALGDVRFAAIYDSFTTPRISLRWWMRTRGSVSWRTGRGDW